MREQSSESETESIASTSEAGETSVEETEEDDEPEVEDEEEPTIRCNKNGIEGVLNGPGGDAEGLNDGRSTPQRLRRPQHHPHIPSFSQYNHTHTHIDNDVEVNDPSPPLVPAMTRPSLKRPAGGDSDDSSEATEDEILYRGDGLSSRGPSRAGVPPSRSGGSTASSIMRTS